MVGRPGKIKRELERGEDERRQKTREGKRERRESRCVAASSRIASHICLPGAMNF